jgi:Flp pilus assembly protein TadD
LLVCLSSACAATGPWEDYEESRSFDEGGDRVPTAATLHSLARVLAARGNDPQCEVVLVHLVVQHPTYAPGYNELAELRLRGGRPAEALAALEQGLAAAATDLVLLNNLGMLHVLEERYAEAVTAFDRALEARPEDVQLRSNRALALGLMGREDEALAAYREVFPLPRAHHNMAVIHEGLGDLEGAGRHYALAAEARSVKRWRAEE